MLEHPDTIRGNIKHYERLLKVDSPNYTHENIRKLLAESRTSLANSIEHGSKTAPPADGNA
jgi:ParB-like chromosome segregation protein Spo0J